MKRPTSKSLNIRAGTGQCGYMLITLMLALALISIGLLAVLPEIGQQIRRDREEEMRNRGTAYMRAIQHFYKKFGRYPTRIEELENTNNLRFLRKRYTDPLNRDPQTGKEKEFKILHQEDVNLNNTPLAGMMPGQQGGLGQVGGAAGIQQNAIANALGGLAQAGGLQTAGAAVTQTPGTSSSDASDAPDTQAGPNPAGSTGSSSPGSAPGSPSLSGLNGPTFGGGPIIGVASTSKAKSIRVFNDKEHYNEWLFVYLPMGDRGGVLNGPLTTNGASGGIGGGMGVGQGGGLPGQNQGIGQSASPFGAQPQTSPIAPTQGPGQNPQQQ